MGKGWMCLSDRCRNDDDDHTKRSKYRQFRERRKLADLCGIVGCLCELDSDPRKKSVFPVWIPTLELQYERRLCW